MGHYVRCSLVVLELIVASFIENDLPAILCHLCIKGCLVNADPSLVGLFRFLYIHVAKHCSDALSHAIVALPRSTRASFAVTRHNIDGFHSRKLWGIGQVRHKTFFEPPSESNLTAAKR
jgi:hypothetical protein